MSLSDHDLIGEKNNQHFTHRIQYSKEIFQSIIKILSKNLLNSVPWENISEETDAKKAWNIFKHFLTEFINKYRPLVEKKVCGRD